MGANTGKYGSSTTAEEVLLDVDLKGKYILITGANTGIGRETARALAAKGAIVYLGCRDQKRGKEAEEAIRKETGSNEIHFLELDLGSLDSVRKAASTYIEKKIPLHILINNAGVMATPYRKTTDGFEYQIGINHFGHFLLTTLLLDLIKASAPAKVVVVSSQAHLHGKLNFDDIHSEKNYSSWGAYGQSKLANILFASELNRRLEGTNVTANSLHPGVIKTELVRDTTLGQIFTVVGGLFLKSIPQGAATTVYVATKVEGGGRYYADCDVLQPSIAAQDVEAAKKLWELSEKLVNVPLLLLLLLLITLMVYLSF